MTDTREKGKKPVLKGYKYRIEITGADIIDATQGNTEGPPCITNGSLSWRKIESAEDHFQSWVKKQGTMTFAETIPSLIAGKFVKRRSWTFYNGVSIYEDRLCYNEEPYVLALDDLLADDWEVIE